MLLLWDRNVLSYRNLAQVQSRGAHLLARVKRHLVLTVRQALADGSYLSQVYPSAKDRRHDRHGLVVRVIEYTLDDPARGAPGVVHRLVTTLLDARAHPAEALIELYHQRWEEEATIDELKTHPRERPVLRSQTPGGVVQEIEGLAAGPLRDPGVAARGGRTPGDRPAPAVVRGGVEGAALPVAGGAGRGGGPAALVENLLAEVGEDVLQPRRDRINPRVIKRKMSKWAKKRPRHRQHPQPSKPFRESIVIT